jgi:hypothetical protein
MEQEKTPVHAQVREIVSGTIKDTNRIERFVYCITNYSKQYNINPVILTKRIRTESRFNALAMGDYDGLEFQSYGCSQIKVKYFSHLLYLIDNGNLGRYLKKREKEGKQIEFARYFLRIGYSVEMHALILSNYLDKYSNNYIKAISGYGFGLSHPSHKRLLENTNLIWDENKWYYRFIREAFK